MAGNALESKFSEVEDLLDKAEQKAGAFRDRDRSVIAQRVIWLYVVTVGICFLYVATAALFNSNGDRWRDAAEFLLQVLTTAVLPIVTLVLGYYFGTAKAEAE